jgi:hypothetical protein
VAGDEAMTRLTRDPDRAHLRGSRAGVNLMINRRLWAYDQVAGTAVLAEPQLMDGVVGSYLANRKGK